jgi:choline dehydrogenase-like flavoprotein
MNAQKEKAPMIIDARTLPDGEKLETAVCIVGGGAAGITLALELTGRSIPVILLESGGLDFEDAAHDLNNGSCVSDWKIDPVWTRLRQLGGTTGHWGGNCAPLDPWDFDQRPWVEDSGWPFGRSEIEPFYPKAFEYCQLPSDDFSADHWAATDDDFARCRIPAGTDLTEKVYLKSPPTRFGEVYRDRLSDENGLCTVYLHAHVQEIETDDAGISVTSLRLAGPDGRTVRVAARTFILAGGLENARLLLLSTSAQPRGLGNGYDTVGRWFMTHLAVRTGIAQVTVADGAARFYGLGGWESRFQGGTIPFCVGLQPTADFQRRNQILNCSVFLDESYAGEKSPGFKALRRIARRVLHGQTPDDLAGDLASVIGDIDDVASALYGRVTGNAAYRLLELGYFAEQAPNRDSRLMLGDDFDAFGQRQLVIDWHALDIDKLTILKTQALMAREFGAAGLGRLRTDFDLMTDPWPHTPDSAAHFMGSTRMSDNPRRGVVDSDCRVHDMENLYIAGGSVFPTSGSAMVTMNIVALSVRLANHLGSQLSAQGGIGRKA